MEHIRKVFLDASALLTWLLYPDIDEFDKPGGKLLSEYLKRPTRQPYSNEPCITEVLARLKWMRHYKEISDNGYFARIELLKVIINHRTLHVSNFNYWENKYTDKAIDLVRKSQARIDFIDALQIVDVSEGPFKFFAGPSVTLLITTDKKLRDVAREEGVEVWCPIDETTPD